MLVAHSLLLLLAANIVQGQGSCVQHFPRIMMCDADTYMDPILMPIPEEANSTVLSFNGDLEAELQINLAYFIIKLWHKSTGTSKVMFRSYKNIGSHKSPRLDLAKNQKIWFAWDGQTIEAGRGAVVGRNRDVSFPYAGVKPPYMALDPYSQSHWDKDHNIDVTMETFPCASDFGVRSMISDRKSDFKPSYQQVNLPDDFDSDHQCLIIRMDTCRSNNPVANLLLKKNDVPLSTVSLEFDDSDAADKPVSVRNNDYCWKKSYQTDKLIEPCNHSFTVFISSSTVKIIGVEQRKESKRGRNSPKIITGIPGFGSFDSFIAKIQGKKVTLWSSVGDCA